MTGNLATNTNYLLTELGVSESEEQLYRLLLRCDCATASELARTSSLSSQRAQRVLHSLEDKGLAVRVSGPAPRYRPTVPELGIESLILRKQAVLERVRSTMRLLNDEAAQSNATSNPAEGIVELVKDEPAIAQAYTDMQRTTRNELCRLISKPLSSASPGKQEHIQEQIHARGVRCRSILPSEVLADPAAMERLRAPANPEQSRISQRLPFGLLIADRRMALLPLDAARPDGPSLLVRSSSLLAGLSAMFEMIWERSTPVEFTANSPDSALALSPFPKEMEPLLSLLAAGFADKAIAHQLGISVRTLLRRVASLMTALDARSRFQAGWSAALRAYGISSADACPKRGESEHRVVPSAMADPRN